MSLRFLVMEGSPAAARERYRAALGRTPAEHYGEVLVQVAGSGSFDVVCPADPDGKLPEGAVLRDYDGVAITGSPLHLWKREPESLRQVELAREIYRSGVPFFGSCWGLQVAAVAAGGDVQKNPRGREFGFARRIAPTAEGARHAMLAGRPSLFDAPCSHLDEVAALPADSTLLASNAVSRVQAAEFRYQGGTFWGVQYHPEYVHAVIAYILEQRAGDLVAEGFFADAAQGLAYAKDLATLDTQPRKDICWRLGLNADVVDPVQRRTEIVNFVAWCKAEAGQRNAA